METANEKKLCPFTGMQECRSTECALYDDVAEKCVLFGAADIYRIDNVVERLDKIEDLLNAIGECIGE